jgi:hypothetical protein
MKRFIFLILILLIPFVVVPKEKCSFANAEEALDYYSRTESCSRFQELYVIYADRISLEAREMILQRAETFYSKDENIALKAFLCDYLPEWNKKAQRILIPCYIGIDLFKGKDTFIIAFVWENYDVTLEVQSYEFHHKMVFVVDLASGVIIETAECFE